MRNSTYLFYSFLFLAIMLLAQCTQPLIKPAKKDWNAPNDWFFNQRAYPNQQINAEALKEVKLKHWQSRQESIQRSTTLEYNFVGPANMSGRVVDIEMFSDDVETVLVGTASGGVFKSDDFGDTWYPTTDDLPTLSISDIEIAPSNENIVYLATGEPNAGGGSLAYDGLGIFKSLDRGTTWQATNLDYSGSIGKIIVDPTDENKVIAGMMGRLFENDEERGIYITQDGGETWQQTLYIDDATGIIDLEINPDNPQIVYAAAWSRVRRPGFRDYGGTGSGIYQSIDGGMTWNLLTSYHNNDVSLGRIALGIAPSNPNKLYALSSDGDGPLRDIQVTEDGGSSWSSVSTNGITSVPFMWWFGSIEVDPSDEDKVFYPGFNNQYSFNGGNSWNTAGGGIHVDHHTVFVHPQDSDLVLIGHDGGAHFSLNGGTTYQRFVGIPNFQFYTCEVDPGNDTHVLGGSQDNGTNRTFQTDSTWEHVLGGDGFVVEVDPINSNKVYAEFQRGAFHRSTNGGNTFISATNGLGGGLFNWKTPFAIDPLETSTLYIGGNRMYKSTNSAITWTTISDDLSGNPDNSNLNYGTITAIDVSSLNNNNVICGTDNGKVHLSANGGNTWTEVSDDLPDYWVTSVVADLQDAETYYVTFSGYRYAVDEGYVYMTQDGGNTWIDLTSDLPRVPVNDLVVTNSGLMFVATDFGVFENSDEAWTLSNLEMPMVVCTDLDYMPNSELLTVATYGRGIYQAQLPKLSATEEVINQTVLLYPNPAQSKITLESPIEVIQEVIISDMSGKIVLSKRVSDLHQVEIDITHLEHGTYSLVSSSQSSQTTQQFVKH